VPVDAMEREPPVAMPVHARVRQVCAHRSKSQRIGSSPRRARASTGALGTTSRPVSPGSERWLTTRLMLQSRSSAIPSTSHTTCSTGNRRLQMVAVPVAAPPRSRRRRYRPDKGLRLGILLAGHRHGTSWSHRHDPGVRHALSSANHGDGDVAAIVRVRA